MPYLAHLPATAAENDIVAAGLVVGTLTYQRSTIPLGDVISTYPPVSSSVAATFHTVVCGFVINLSFAVYFVPLKGRQT